MDTKFINRLCPKCTLCCNGVLFADVELQRGDDAAALSHSGVSVFRRGRRSCFHQPCTALQSDGFCGAYGHRPAMCRKFECGVLKQVAGGALTEAEGMHRIRKAQRLVKSVEKLLRQLGNREEQLALVKRYQAVMMEPIDLEAGESMEKARGRLMIQMQELMDLLSREFLAEADEKSV